jgi:hypothetical protein
MVREQIRAAEELGLDSWVLWNPRSAYDPAIFRPKSAALGAVPAEAKGPNSGTH